MSQRFYAMKLLGRWREDWLWWGKSQQCGQLSGKRFGTSWVWVSRVCPMSNLVTIIFEMSCSMMISNMVRVLWRLICFFWVCGWDQWECHSCFMRFRIYWARSKAVGGRVGVERGESSPVYAFITRNTDVTVNQIMVIFFEVAKRACAVAGGYAVWWGEMCRDLRWTGECIVSPKKGGSPRVWGLRWNEMV